MTTLALRPISLLRRAAGCGWPGWLVCLVFAALLYTSITTVDINLGAVPLKLPLVATALTAWAIVRLRGQRVNLPPSAVPVLAVGVLIPIIWFGVTELRIHAGDPSQRNGTHYAVQQASRFVYLLLYLPIYDFLSSAGARAELIWRFAVHALCLITFGLFAAYLLGADFGYTGALGPFRGGLGVDESGTFRVFLVNDILFIPALVFVLGDLWAFGASKRLAGEFAILLAATYLSHTRGIWIGICVAVALAVVLYGLWRLRGPVRSIMTVVVWAVVAAGLVVSADPDIGGRVAHALLGNRELSNAIRFQQIPKLLSAISLHPAFGSGLGATLPSGYFRSPDSPWSFELSYLQLLFQIGVVGLAVLSALPLWSVARRGRQLPQAAAQRVKLAIAVGGLVGFLDACASNPYLMTSVGMLALAIFLATLDQIREQAASPGANVP